MTGGSPRSRPSASSSSATTQRSVGGAASGTSSVPQARGCSSSRRIVRIGSPTSAR